MSSFKTQTKLESHVADAAKSEEGVGTFTDAFKNAVTKYCEKDDKRMKLQNEICSLRKELKNLESDIMKFMDTNDVPMFDTGEKGLFKSATRKKTKGINKKFLIESLAKCGQLKDPKKAEEVVAYIYDSRPTEDVKSLSRKT